MYKNLDQLKKQYDSSNMFDVLLDYPNQFKKSFEIFDRYITEYKNITDSNNFNKVIILGMGGSAIGGEIIANILYQLNSDIEIFVNRDYTINKNIDSKTLIIASSYSGNTEETIEAFNLILSKTNNIVCVTTGGKLKELAEKLKLRFITLPGGLQPRCALLYSLFVNINVIISSKFIENNIKKEINKSIHEIREKIINWTKLYSTIDSNNTSILMAESFQSKTPVIYSTSKLSSVNLRWQGQIQENAKIPAFGNILPEMNHNEINAWDSDKFKNDFSVLILADQEHKRNNKRIKLLQELINPNVNTRILEMSSKYYLTRIIEFIILGDWMSYYLALLLKKDPTDIPLITELKNKLS